MFEDSLVESSGTLRRRNPWTAAISFCFQLLLAGALVWLPLIHTEALPWRQLTAIVNAPVTPPPPAPASPDRPHSVPMHPVPAEEPLRMPSFIPKRVEMVHDDLAHADGNTAPDLAAVPGGTGTGVPNSVINNIVQSVPAIPKIVAPPKVRVSSGVAQGLLIRQVNPAYPPIAMQARIQGTVVLQAVIAKDGTVKDLRVISGHPLLVPAALNAVQFWRYKPYVLNDQPVEVDTQVIVNFTLGSR
jgi:protein TonB